MPVKLMPSSASVRERNTASTRPRARALHSSGSAQGRSVPSRVIREPLPSSLNSGRRSSPSSSVHGARSVLSSVLEPAVTWTLSICPEPCHALGSSEAPVNSPLREISIRSGVAIPPSDELASSTISPPSSSSNTVSPRNLSRAIPPSTTTPGKHARARRRSLSSRRLARDLGVATPEGSPKPVARIESQAPWLAPVGCLASDSSSIGEPAFELGFQPKLRESLEHRRDSWPPTVDPLDNRTTRGSSATGPAW